MTERPGEQTTPKPQLLIITVLEYSLSGLWKTDRSLMVIDGAQQMISVQALSLQKHTLWTPKGSMLRVSSYVL